MRKNNLAFIDIETTGLEISRHEIIEIGGVITTPRLRVIEKFEIKIKPENIRNADPTALKINHYNPLGWERALSLEEGMKIFSARTAGCIMIGQNVSFDAKFLEYALEKNNIKNELHYHKIDTMSMAWAKLHKKRNVTHFSLRELCKHFGIENEHAHSALSDAYATFELYKKLMGL